MGRTFPWVVVCFAVLALSTACFPDFDRFKNVSGSEDAGNEDVVEDALDTSVPDLAPDLPPDTSTPDTSDDTAIDSEDVADEEVTEAPTLGLACGSDVDCDEGETCATELDGGMCTVTCASDGECPDGYVCGQPATASLCLPACPAGTCERGGYHCRALTGLSEAACVTDTDDDLVINSVDNCPQTANPDQSNADGDERGDACDPLVKCPQPAAQAVLAADVRATPPRPLQGGALVHMPSHDSLLYIAGRDADGQPVADVNLYSITDDQWLPGAVPDFPFPAQNVVAAYDRWSHEVVATSGSEPDFDSLVILSEDAPGQWMWRLGAELPTKIHRGSMIAVARDKFVITGYTQPGPADPGFQWLLYSYDRSDDSFAPIGAPVTPNPAGDVVSILQDNVVYMLNSRDPLNYFQYRVGGTFDSAPLGTALFATAADADQAIAGFSGPSPLAYYANFSDNLVRRVRVDNKEVDDTPYTFASVATDPATAIIQSVFIPESLSFFTLTTEGAPPASAAHQIFLGCADNTAAFDDDGDGIFALDDNCPVVHNADQLDIDHDGAGDICDPDADGDGIDDASDLYLGDTDNDGLVNDIDEDDDGDRIPDVADPLPLDADNDGLANDEDDDDDGDGFSDTEENNAGSNPFDILSMPGGERVVFVTDNAGTRQLFVTTFVDLADGVELTPVDTQGRVPAFPKIMHGTQTMLFSDITSPLSPVLVLQQLDAGTQQIATVTGLKPSATDFWPGGSRVVFVRQGVNWNVELMPLGSFGLVTATQIHSQVGEILGLDVPESESVALFSSGPDCAICLDVQRLDLNSGAVVPQASTESGISEYGATAWTTTAAIVFLADDAGVARAFVAHDGEITQATPDDMHVAKADFAGATRRVVVSARPADQPGAPYQLYLYDWRDQWTMQLTDGLESVVEVSFAR